MKEEIIVALCGNPNVGKSTIFNRLTGSKQHTGNWTGKTVVTAKGYCDYSDKKFLLMDLPGTYSLMSNSKEEETARNYICFNKPDAVAVVADATCLERNLNLLFQVMELTGKVVLCVNLTDEADLKKITIDFEILSCMLDIPVIPMNAKKDDLKKVLEAVEKVIEKPSKFNFIYGLEIEAAIKKILPKLEEYAAGKISPRFAALRILGGDKKFINSIENFLGADFNDAGFLTDLNEAKKFFIDKDFQNAVCSNIVNLAESITNKTVIFNDLSYLEKDRKIDKILTSKLFGIPIMITLLAAVFFITIIAANYPSKWLALGFSFLEKQLNSFFNLLNTPYFIQAPLMDGIYKTTAWVISAMLPPMAIFFPLFTLLEDLGYLPRVAFTLDNRFKKSGGTGKQSLCMCMGFGCNAAGVTSTRIIDSDKERLSAILTNNFVPCNGRFPTLIAISTIFMGNIINSAALSGLISAAVLTSVILTGIAATFLVSKILAKTVLRGAPSKFVLELPPYRKPQILKTIIRSFKDKTIFVLKRAVLVAIPAGLIIWLLANLNIAGIPLISYAADFFQPFAKLMGLDGNIFISFILGFPANEIVMPLAVLSYTNSGILTDYNTLNELGNLLALNGWTIFTGISVLIFTLFHFPCATTLITIIKEAGFKWALLAFILPTLIGIILCICFTQTINILKIISL